MERNESRRILRLEKGRLRSIQRGVVQEFPLTLFVNGRKLATLVASPHQLNFLVAGFFRTNGFVEALDDFLALGSCEKFGVARVRIKKEVSVPLSPTLTSGCGTGITFDLQKNLSRMEKAPDCTRYPPEAIFSLMGELARRAENYRAHGGIHSAAVGDGRSLLLYAEDIGRHNTFDRIAGEALFRGIDLRGKLMATSGRVSIEMVAKAARLGIGLIASRTSPTDQAIRLCEEAGITLVGYLRGESFEVYCCHEGLELAAPTKKISGITGVILAGGESRRMGSDKSLLPIQGARFIDHVYDRMEELFDEVFIVTNSPEFYREISCRKVPDIYPSKGSLTGIHSGLCHAGQEKVFVAACDMPFLSAETIRRLCLEKEEGDDVVVPRSGRGVEPLHALYDKRCLPAIETVLSAGEKRIVSFFPQVRVHEVPEVIFKDCDPEGRSFRNINTPQEYFALRDRGKEEDKSGRERPLSSRKSL
ncbi:MAG: formate dehydrogenase accessory sulfurtransferase FdhD [Desulfuromonadales bacterium]|jgi:FdhD protein